MRSPGLGHSHVVSFAVACVGYGLVCDVTMITNGLPVCCCHVLGLPYVRNSGVKIIFKFAQISCIFVIKEQKKQLKKLQD